MLTAARDRTASPAAVDSTGPSGGDGMWGQLMRVMFGDAATLPAVVEPFTGSTIYVLAGLVFSALAVMTKYLWLPARGHRGIDAWAHRVALEEMRSYAGQRETMERLYAVDRRRRQLVATFKTVCVTGVAVVALAGCIWLAVQLQAARAIDVLTAAYWLTVLGFGVGAARLGLDVFTHGASELARDESIVVELAKKLKDELATQSLQPAGAASAERSTSPDITSSTVIVTTEVESILIKTPSLFRPILRDRIRDCMYSFEPHCFVREHQCVSHLEEAIDQVANDRDRSKVDVLALCVDKTQGADFVQRYWRKNLQAAQAGVYISRVFVYDSANRASVENVAREQQRAGVHVFTIARAVIERFLQDTYGLDVFGFTVVQGVDRLDQVVLHQGVGDSVKAAYFAGPLLTQYFAGVHAAIREHSELVRALRPERTSDPSRTLVHMQVHGRDLEARRLNFGVTREGRSAMSVALERWETGRNLRRDETVLVSADELQLANRPMKVSHYHSVDTQVCSRRLHQTCRTARNGDYIVGLCEVSKAG